MVVEERTPACRLVRLACQRYLDMQEEEFQEEHGFYFCDESAIEACAFIEGLKHIKGDKAMKPFVLEPWQIFKTCAINGFRWQEDGVRVVSVAYLEEPRKHGKSLWAAAFGIYLTTVDGGLGDDLYIIAPKEDQGLKVLEPFQKMCRADRALEGFFEIKHTKKTSRIGKTDSNIIVLAALGEKQDGHDPKIVVADEFHSMPPEIYKVMKSAQRARKEKLFLMIGSAGRQTFGVGWEEHMNAVALLEGKLGPRLHQFVLIYTIDPDDVLDWFTPAVIAKANPGLGISVDRRGIMEEAQDARTKPTDKIEFLRTALNLWGHSEGKLFPKEKWDRCARPGMKIEDFLGQKCSVGIDLAARNDMVCVGALFEKDLGTATRQEDGSLTRDVDLMAFAWHFVPEKGPWAEDADLIAPYQEWRSLQRLTMTPGSMHNFDGVRRVLQILCDNFEVGAILVDDNQANEFITGQIRAGRPVQTFRKNASNFTDPTKDLMARINGEEMRFFHDGNPVLAWNFQNVIGGFDTSGRILGKKPAPNSNMKIDGFDCIVMANAHRLEMVKAPDVQKPSGSVQFGVRQV